jgi:hypothetical protein
MRKRRLSSTAAVLLMLHLQAACSSHREVPLSSIAPRSDVQVRFPTPANVMIGYHETDPVRRSLIPQVRAIDGRFAGVT